MAILNQWLKLLGSCDLKGKGGLRCKGQIKPVTKEHWLCEQHRERLTKIVRQDRNRYRRLKKKLDKPDKRMLE